MSINTRRLVSLLLPVAVLLGACSNADDATEPSDSPASDSPASASSGAASSDEQSTEQASPTEVQTSTAAGECPYLSTEDVAGIVGQMILETLVTTTTPPTGPLPGCTFRTYDDEAAASIETLTIEAGTGLERALELVPGGNPVDVGEGGSVLVHQGQAQTQLAAFAGTTMVTVTINQESSLEAEELAKLVLAAG
ncbi:DUF2020 domain-containing protein [Cumulibacter soli]|uniref:DUF2020 domain-containing protein n=1 Tax=Cumulibacter soli TaxID=2546344 RepID=UPI00106814FA|nr:DUF2020 domain-containing protein [Cumulibacter soli]